MSDNKKVTILIRSFNEEEYIGDLLRAIQKQTYKNHEIVLVDSGSDDETVPIARKFTDKIISIPSDDFTFGYSLNVGCKEATGEYIVIVSAHTLPLDDDWLAHLVEPFQDKMVAMTYGSQIATLQNAFSERQDLKRMFGGKNPYVNNANSAIRKDLWEQHQFDEYLTGLEDIEWSEYFKEKGYKTVYKPEAEIYHIHREKNPQVFNRYRREAIAAARMRMLSPPQAHPSFTWFLKRVGTDLLATLAEEITLARIREIINFRFQQWKGTRYGWYKDKDTDLGPKHYELYYPTANPSVQITGPGSARLENLPLPDVIKPSEVLIKVAYVGVCATDLEVYNGTFGAYKKREAQYPIVPGHEFSGIVWKVGANARDKVQVNDKVVGQTIIGCNKCEACNSGESTACAQREEVGVIHRDGAYCRYVTLPIQAVHKVPETTDLRAAALIEPLAVSVRAAQKISNTIQSPGAPCAVLGAGPVGNLCAQVLTQKGYSVTVFDKNQGRLNTVRNIVELATHEIQKLDTFSVIVEASGSADLLQKALAFSAHNTTIVPLGVHYGSVDYPFEDIVANEKMIIGSLGANSEDFQKAIEILPKLEFDSLINTIMPLEEFRQAWELHKAGKHLKILLETS